MDMAVKMLADAKRQQLTHINAAEYSTAMANYYTGVIDRLTKYIKED